MTRRRLVPLALVVTALLVVVAIAAHGKPLGSGGSSNSGLPLSFWSFLFTTLVIVEILLFVVAVVALFVFRRERTERVRPKRSTARTLAILIGGVALLSFVMRHIDLHHLLHSNRPKPGALTTPTLTGQNGKPLSRHQHVQFRWEELVVVLGLLLGIAVLAAATRSHLGGGRGPRRAAPELLAAALDESLDDLRADPRMETALGAAGLPRDPAEAPFEYVERALLTLDTSAEAVRRLTDLFVWARFSQHEPEPSMRDDAVDALVAVRDELRASELVPA
jgi:hypothetical protein